jgi:hypothetical protein
MRLGGFTVSMREGKSFSEEKQCQYYAVILAPCQEELRQVPPRNLPGLSRGNTGMTERLYMLARFCLCHAQVLRMVRSGEDARMPALAITGASWYTDAILMHCCASSAARAPCALGWEKPHRGQTGARTMLTRFHLRVGHHAAGSPACSAEVLGLFGVCTL